MAAPWIPPEVPLEPGDHLDQQTFQVRYHALPDQIKAELTEGVVFLASP